MTLWPVEHMNRKYSLQRINKQFCKNSENVQKPRNPPTCPPAPLPPSPGQHCSKCTKESPNRESCRTICNTATRPPDHTLKTKLAPEAESLIKYLVKQFVFTDEFLYIFIYSPRCAKTAAETCDAANRRDS